jgi:tetratricopeptide (TPR) repeat protein
MNYKLTRAAWALIFLVAWSGVAGATDDSAKSEARNLANEAKRDFDAGRLEDAQLKFQNAYAIAKVPTLALWAARVLVKRGQFVAASEFYRQATQLAANDLWIGNAQQKAQGDAKRELAALEPRIAKLRIHLQGAAADQVELAVDDVKVDDLRPESELRADPGRHRVVGKTRAQTVVFTVDLAEGEHKDALVRFDEVAQATGSGRTPTTDPLAKALPAAAQAGAANATSLTDNSLSSAPVNRGQPVYAKWWFWTGVGAVVIAGSVTAFALARHSAGACGGAGVPCVEVK